MRPHALTEPQQKCLRAASRTCGLTVVIKPSSTAARGQLDKRLSAGQRDGRPVGAYERSHASTQPVYAGRAVARMGLGLYSLKGASSD